MGKKMIKVSGEYRSPAIKNKYLGANTFRYGQWSEF